MIGGSIAYNLKKKGLAKEVVGVSRHKQTLSLAKRLGVIDKGSLNLDIIRGADLVILATPVDTIIDLAKKISRLVSRECIVSDVGSSKQKIVAKLEKIFPRYIGTHPLAGSEKRGIANAQSVAFKGSLCIVTPTRHSDEIALAKVNKLWSALGAKTVFLSPETHDKISSFVSHLAHVVSFSLIAAMPKGYLRFASGGLRDTTRIAASESNLWADIFLSNENNILRALRQFERQLGRIKSAIKKRDKKDLFSILEEARNKRKILG